MNHKKFHKTTLLVLILCLLLIPVSAGDIQCEWSGVEKIVAIGDVHGDYDNFVLILKQVHVVDDDLAWIAGKTHLVQLGDIMDRGSKAKQILDLLKELERQAEDVGGKVHVLLGNHEEANILGFSLRTPGYVNPEQFASFLPEDYRIKREKKIREKYANNNNSDLSLAEMLYEFWQEEKRKNKMARQTYIKFFYKNYGKWFLTKNAIIKINDIVFVHGGVSERFSKWELKKINDVLHSEIKYLYRGFQLQPRPVMAYQPDAPHWLRDLIQNDEEDLSQDVDRILKNLNANYMVVGHTVRSPEVFDSRKLDRFQGRVWGIDTGISNYYGGHLSALIIENGKFKVWWGTDD